MTVVAISACGQVRPVIDQSATGTIPPTTIQSPTGFEPEPNLREPLNAPCSKTSEDRKSALCAQWVSAEAAADSARWALYSLVLGMLTLGSAVLAALFAYRSAKAAKDQLQHERSLILPRFEVAIEGDVYSGSNNSLYVTIQRVGDNLARDLGLDEVILHQGALGPRGRLEQSSSASTVDEGQRLTANFRFPGEFDHFPSADKVTALFDQPAAFTIRWHYTDVAGNLRRTETVLTGCIRNMKSSLRQQTGTIALAGTTFHERA